jgi:hypothetical protein
VADERGGIKAKDPFGKQGLSDATATPRKIALQPGFFRNRATEGSQCERGNPARLDIFS